MIKVLLTQINGSFFVNWSPFFMYLSKKALEMKGVECLDETC